jgi:hypothetical protein
LQTFADAVNEVKLNKNGNATLNKAVASTDFKEIIFGTLQ